MLWWCWRYLIGSGGHEEGLFFLGDEKTNLCSKNRKKGEKNMDQAAGLILQLKKGNKQNSSRLTVCEIHLFSSRERTDEI